MGFEGGAQTQDGREGVAQVVGDEGEELVLGLLQVALGGDIADHTLEPGGHASLTASAGRDLQHAAHAVGPAHGQLRALAVVGVDREALEHAGSFDGRQHVRESGVLELREWAPEDHRQRCVRKDDPAVEIDLEDAVGRMLDHVLVVRAALFLTTHDGLPVATRHGVDQAVHGGQDTGQQQRQGETPVPTPLLGHFHGRLHDKVARDAQYDEELRQRRAAGRRRGTDLLEVADQRLVDLFALAGHGQDGLEAVAGLLDEPGPLRRPPGRRLGKDGGEDVEGAARHLLRAAVESREQRLRVGRLAFGREEVACPAVGVAGDEGLEVADGEARTVGTLRRRRQIAGLDEGVDTLGGEVEQGRGLVEAHEPRFPHSIAHGCAAFGGCP